MVALLLAQVILFSVFPIYFSFLTGPLRRVSFYVYIALVLLIGGFFGNIYTLPITPSINVSGGNLCYGAFMMASVIFVLIERDAFVLRHLVRMVIMVDVFNVLFSDLVSRVLNTPGVINPHQTPASLFDVSIPFIILGGALIIVELFFLFFCFEKIKRLQWPYALVALSLVILFILVLCADGILFPFIAFGVSPPVISIVIGGFSGKLLMASLFSLPLVIFALFRRRAFADYLSGDTVTWSLMFTTSGQIMREISDKNYGLKQAETVFDTTREGLAIVDQHGALIKANPAFAEMMSLPYGSQNVKTPIYVNELFTQLGGEGSLESLHQGWRGEIAFGVQSEHKGILSVVPVEAESAQHAATFIYALINIDELKQAQERLSFLATHDPLTGLVNRRVLDERLSQSHGQVRSLIVIDLDHFKDVNDSYGHRAGDEVLMAVSERLHKVVVKANCDVGELCRTGGDEFAALIYSADEELIKRLCERIQEALKPVITLSGGSEIHVSATLGVSRQAMGQSCDMLQEADAALYSEKALQRGGIGFYKEQLTQLSQRKMQLHSKLKKAIEAASLTVFYQPQYDAQTRLIVGVEALARWRDEELGWVSPGEFIPVAEETGLIEKLGEWVLRQACFQGKMWIEQGFVDLKISVNVSAHQLRFGQFLDMVKSVLKLTDLPASALQLELTESAFIERQQEVIPQLSALKSLGVQLAIDDFGTGYSSLSYVASLPWDTLKIDRSFIDKLPDDKAQRQMTDTIIQLAKNMGLVIIVEGVETQEQLAYLAERGCDIIQGFFFSPAIEANAVAQQLAG